MMLQTDGIAKEKTEVKSKILRLMGRMLKLLCALGGEGNLESGHPVEQFVTGSQVKRRVNSRDFRCLSDNFTAPSTAKARSPPPTEADPAWKATVALAFQEHST